MKRTMKLLAVGSLLAASALYAGTSTAACAGCHGKNFEKKAMGKSKVVKDMSHEAIVAALKGYKDGSYGGAMKGLMKGQVASLSDADMKAIADQIKGGASTSSAPKTEAKSNSAKIININETASDKARISKEDLGNKKVVTEEALGLRKVDLYSEDKAAPVAADFNRPAPGQATKFERAYVNAPPMIPHSVDGLLPITKDNNQCLGCHMPEVAKGVGATPIPPSHFTNYRPETVLKNGEVVKEGKKVGIKGDIGNTSDIKIAKAKKLDHLYQGRFNCSQCHAPQAKIDPIVGNTFKPDGLVGDLKSHSDLVDVMNEGVQ
jgi:cytochrome c-type protein NapB